MVRPVECVDVGFFFLGVGSGKGGRGWGSGKGQGGLNKCMPPYKFALPAGSGIPRETGRVGSLDPGTRCKVSGAGLGEES